MAMAIWPHLKETPTGFVDHLFSGLPRALLAYFFLFFYFFTFLLYFFFFTFVDFFILFF